MEYYAEWRLRGDRYSDGFGNGMTLSSSESVQGMEKISEDAELTVFRGKKGHLLKVFHEAKRGATFCRTVFENTTNETATLELLSSVAIRGIKADRMHRATSYWSAEGKLLSQELTELNMEPSWANHGYRVTRFGQLGSMPVRGWFPFLVMEDSESGRFIGLQLYCASSWQIEVFRKSPEISIQAGLADRDYGSWWKEILPGETFESPLAVVAEGSSLQEVCDRLVKAQQPRISPVDQEMPVIFNEWCTTWGNPNMENLERIASRLEGTGVKYLVIDAGWYKSPEYDNWFNAAGDWNPSRELFPEGNIGAAADLIRAHGLIPGIWFEMENVGTEAKAYQDTDLLLTRDGTPVSVGARRFRDMRLQRNWDFLDQKMIRLLRENGFGYLKVDYNECIGAGVDGAESCGEGLRQAVCASQDFFRHIAQELPELVIENCSSGGHRLEPSMMALVSQASFSDAHEALSIPLIAANLHRLIRPEQSQIWAVLRANADEHRINYVLASAFLGRMCISGDAADLPQDRWQQALDAVTLYAQVRHIIRDGCTDVIESTVKDYSNPRGYQIVRRVLGDEMLLVAHTFADGAYPPLKQWMEGYQEIRRFGSPLNDVFQGAVIWGQRIITRDRSLRREALRREYRFYGWETADVTDGNGLTPGDYYDLLSEIWCAETCAPRMRDRWTPENITLGQCSVTAFLIQDIFGGKVYGIPLKDGGFHCFNEVGGRIFDLTSEQFEEEKLDYSNCPEQKREAHFAREEKRLRYELLKRRLESRMKNKKICHRGDQVCPPCSMGQ